jgi:hypothetical protein
MNFCNFEGGVEGESGVAKEKRGDGMGALARIFRGDETHFWKVMTLAILISAY